MSFLLDTLADSRFLTFSVFVVLVLVWFKTGRDPLFWLIRGINAFRAALILAGTILVEACGEFRRRFSDQVEQSKKEVIA